jgi:hypothetical protein
MVLKIREFCAQYFLPFFYLIFTGSCWKITTTSQLGKLRLSPVYHGVKIYLQVGQALNTCGFALYFILKVK